MVESLFVIKIMIKVQMEVQEAVEEVNMVKTVQNSINQM